MHSKNRLVFMVAVFLSLVVPAYSDSGHVGKGSFRFEYGDRGITAVSNPADPFGATVTSSKLPVGLVLRYQVKDGTWAELNFKRARGNSGLAGDSVRFESSDRRSPLKVSQSFWTDGKVLDWGIDIETTSGEPVKIGDLAIRIPENRPEGEDERQIFERSFVRHQFISGNGSFLYFVRASGTAPFLMVTVQPGTKLEYFTSSREGVLDFIHSGLTGNKEKRGTWRQEHTYLTLNPVGKQGSAAHYGFRFRWANSCDEMREILYEEGLFDTRVVPGMVIPNDLSARFSIRTRAHVDSLDSEFPDQTQISEIGRGPSGEHLFEVVFYRLGENKITIHHDSGRSTYLEFFVTEPLETLIKKRSAFLVEHQQVRDPSKWWDGVFAPYDMRTGVVRTPDDPDIFTGRMSYVLTCDDPGLSKAPFIAEKNVSFPVEKEIRALEYYLQHFVWGKLQRTGDEQPYPYGVYGTPDWYTNRDPQRRAKATNKNLDKMHVWRSYDYPHVVMLYYHMYEIAKKYPQLSNYLDANGYLERAWQTAHAFYIYPYQIFPSYYETYKWGLYNELVVLRLAEALDREGLSDRAAWLRAEWEKKVKYFVYDDPYPYRSEYAFDRTAFESSYAFAKYGATHDMKPDKDLWWDVQKKKWYSHPAVRQEDSRQFMERQLLAGLAVRGWLEPEYYKLGADHGLSYMAAMGGWGILDYGLNFCDKPSDWLQLGYASYLSSWSLMNTGPADSNYGYWFPGKEKDGAAGWEYMEAKYGYAWMGASVPRGAWSYDGEIDLGFGAALRMAATVLTRDPLFGWTAYGGVLRENGEQLSILPHDGLRQRFAAILRANDRPGAQIKRLKLELDRDGFAEGQPISTDKQLTHVAFRLENRTGDRHWTVLHLALPAGEPYQVSQDGKLRTIEATDDPDYPLQVLLNVERDSVVEIAAVPR